MADGGNSPEEGRQVGSVTSQPKNEVPLGPLGRRIQARQKEIQVTTNNNPVESVEPEWVKRAREGKLPTKDMTGQTGTKTPKKVWGE